MQVKSGRLDIRNGKEGNVNYDYVLCLNKEKGQLEKDILCYDGLDKNSSIIRKANDAHNSEFNNNCYFYQRKSKSGKYFDLAADVGVGENQITRGIAIADVDHDGDLDFATADQWMPSHLYRNDYAGKNSFLGLTLLFPVQKDSIKNIVVDGDAKGRNAIGATVKVKLPDGKT